MVSVTSSPHQRSVIASMGVLGEESRWRLFAFVRATRRAVTREEAAEYVGISRKLAAFHLDKMVEAGLLRTRSASTDAVPKVGRRPKAYEALEEDLAVSIPGRQYELLADLLIDTIVSESSGGSGQEAAARTARAHGRELGSRDATLFGEYGAHENAIQECAAMLEARGYEPATEPAGTVLLRNCPFHPLAAKAPELVCAMNHAFLDGYLEGRQLSGVEAVLAPSEGECCVHLAPRR